LFFLTLQRYNNYFIYAIFLSIFLGCGQNFTHKIIIIFLFLWRLLSVDFWSLLDSIWENLPESGGGELASGKIHQI
jgi:hypothetical protein